jgi:competence protein ComFC
MISRVIYKTSEFARSLYGDFKEFLSPSFCLGCNGNILSDDPLLCSSCIETLKITNMGEGPICPFCGRPDGVGDGCRFCRAQKRLRLFFWGEYDGLLKDCLGQFKFGGAIDLGRRLVDMAVDSLHQRITDNRYDLIIPVPLHRSRRRERGFSQSEILARRLAALLQIELNAEILRRIRPTRQQAKLEESQRWENVKNAFGLTVNGGPSISGKAILLVDDIVTTGATIYEAAKPLQSENPKRVDIFCLGFTR